MQSIKRFLLLSALLLVPTKARAEEEGFTPLFNGKDLSGWVPVNVASNTFTVQDGLIVCTGKPTGIMRTDKQYENYVLELEYKHLVPGGNAGLFIWSDPITSPGVPFARSIEVQILDGSESETHTSHGDVFAIHGAKMKPDRPHPRGAMRCLPSEKRAKPAGEWNHYRVVCNDGVLKLSVNGKEVSGASACWPRKGYICLESEGGVVHYRNIKIKETPSTNPRPDEIAPLDDGFKSIYTGIDLSGWKGGAGGEGRWQAKDWILVYDGKGEGKDKQLWTEKAYGEFAMIVDWRLPKGAGQSDSGAIRLRGPAGASVSFDKSAPGSPAVRAAGEWNRFLITAKGPKCTVLLNGKPFAEHDVPAGASIGPVGLCPEGPMEFASIYIKPLS